MGDFQIGKEIQSSLCKSFKLQLIKNQGNHLFRRGFSFLVFLDRCIITDFVGFLDNALD